MRLSRFFKKDVVEIKQPQEYYCSNYDCVEMVACLTVFSSMVDDDESSLSDQYCINCLIDKVNERYDI